MGESENGRLSSSEDSPIPRSKQPVKKSEKVVYMSEKGWVFWPGVRSPATIPE